MLVALALLFSSAAEPSAVPSGMDLLYGDRIAFTPKGEPVVAVGLMTGQKEITVSAAARLVVDYWEGDVQKRSVIGAGQAVRVTIKHGVKAKRQYYVDIEGRSINDEAGLTTALGGWRKRGYPKVRALEEGMVLGLTGRVLDNREIRLVHDVASREDGQKLVRALYDAFGVTSTVKARVLERPRGELQLHAGEAPLGVAVSYVRFVSEDGKVTVHDVEHSKGYAWHGRETRSYTSEVYVVLDADAQLAAVSVTGAETLLRGVVPAELFASAPEEALRAQAVAARNHLLAKLGKRHHDDPFHLCSEQHCQVYAGVIKEDPRASQAVADTAGQALFLNGKLVDSVYSSSCGGHTEDNDAVWGDAANPALRGRPDMDGDAAAVLAQGLAGENLQTWLRSAPEAYCKKASRARLEKFRWQRVFSADELNQRVALVYPRLGRVKNIEVQERGIGGRVVSLRLVGEKGTVTVLHELPIRKLFDNLNSGAFVIEATRGSAGELLTVTFLGGGWGHGVGMCQMGAIGRAEAGQSYREILRHYYNGAAVEQVYGGVL